jgi:signal transduction histidine kinase
MRTPLTAILGYAEYLLESPVEPEDQRDFLQVIVKQGERLHDLIDNLLSLQRLRAGFGLEDPGPVSIPPLLQEVVESFRLPIVQQRIVVDCAPGLQKVFGDEGKIQHAVKNLLGNAVKYSPPWGTIVVGARTEEESALLWVRDEGPGIPAEKQEKIFERFYRLGGRKKPGGTGLGLALVREIARAHGGRAWVESSPGEGSTFYLRLPLAE